MGSKISKDLDSGAAITAVRIHKTARFILLIVLAVCLSGFSQFFSPLSFWKLLFNSLSLLPLDFLSSVLAVTHVGISRYFKNPIFQLDKYR